MERYYYLIRGTSTRRGGVALSYERVSSHIRSGMKLCSDVRVYSMHLRTSYAFAYDIVVHAHEY